MLIQRIFIFQQISQIQKFTRLYFYKNLNRNFIYALLINLILQKEKQNFFKTTKILSATPFKFKSF